MKRFKDYWIPDSETYNQIQKLKRFVDFMAGLAFTTLRSRSPEASGFYRVVC